MRTYTHGGLGTPTASQHNLFDLEKLKLFLVLLTGFEPSTLDLQSDALTTEPTHHPVNCSEQHHRGVHGAAAEGEGIQQNQCSELIIASWQNYPD